MYAASTDTRSSPESTTYEWGLDQDPGWMMHSAAALCLSSTEAGPLNRTNEWFLKGAICEIDEATSPVQANHQ